MVNVVEALYAANVAIHRAPQSYAGAFSAFMAQHALPAFPSVERILAFDAYLQRHFERASPCFLVRKVSELERRTVQHNSRGCTLVPTDNSPAWWLHCYLLSSLPFPDDTEVFFRAVPTHMHDIRLRDSLSKAGFHLAHVTNVNNRDTRWQTWDADEASRRMTLNIHPWNWFLIAKSEWQQHGGRRDLIAFIEQANSERYGDRYLRWRQRLGIGPVVAKSSDTPAYAYNLASRVPPKPISPRNPARAASVPVTGQPAPTPTTLCRHPTNRPFVRRDWMGMGYALHIKTVAGEFIVPHDALLDWVMAHTNVPQTRSWRGHGVYSWPRPSRVMLAFLRRYRR